MRTLILMRHAKSDWKQPGMADHDRPLNDRGREAAPLMAEQFAAQGLLADVILASTAARVRETVELLQERWSPAAEVIRSRGLYLASPREIASQIHSLHDSWSTVLVVGHNPGMHSLACSLAGEEFDFPTAAAAVFESEAENWQTPLTPQNWRLRSFWKPRELDLDPL